MMNRKVKKDVIINIRIDSDLKESSKQILIKHDMDHSKIVRKLMKHIEKTGNIPDFLIDKPAP